MALPYLNIDNVSYSTASNVLSVSLTAARIRGYDNENDMIIEGFSQSKTIPITNGFFQGTVTYSLPDLETSTSSVSSTTTYVEASRTFSFTGTASAGQSVRITSSDFNNTNLILHTFSATVSTSAAVAILAATISSFATGLWTGFTAEASNTTLTVKAPWGAYYNGLDITAISSTSSFVVGSPTQSELREGFTNYNLNFVRQNPVLGSLGITTFAFGVGTYSLDY